MKYKSNAVRTFVVLNLHRLAFAIIDVIGVLVSRIPRPKRYVCFTGQQGYFNGNAMYLFDELHGRLGQEFCRKEKKNFLFIVRKGDAPDFDEKGFKVWRIKSSLELIKYAYRLWLTKALIITTPGLDWRIRRIFARSAKTILVSNGVPLKAPGLLTKHFGKVMANKYLYFWKDIDEVWVSSLMEKYVVASSLKFPVEKVKIVGAARQEIFQESEFKKRKAEARYQVGDILNLDTEDKKLILVALTQRAYLEKGKYHSVDSIRRLGDFTEENFRAFLSENNIHIVIRDHFLAGGANGEGFGENSSFMGSDIVSELNDVIPAFDVVITDYSGLYLDLLNLNLPIGLLRYPGDDFLEKRGLILPDAVLTNLISVSSIEDLFVLLLQDTPSDKQRIAMRMLYNLFFEVPPEKCMDSNINALVNIIKSER